MMTWPEVYDAIHHQGKTVALYYTGGNEHRGPQNVNGGHTLMGREIAMEIARRLGNAIVLPIMLAMNYDPIWFGIFMVIVLEMGLISPPVGINVFVVKGIAEDVPMVQIFTGILPFWVAMIVCVALLIAFPQIALFLPNTMIR